MEEIKTPEKPKRAPRTIRMLRMPELRKKWPRSKTMVYADIAEGLFPPPVALGERCSAWVETEVDQIIAARMAGGSDDDVRQIVERLMDERRAALPGFTPTPSQKKNPARDRRGRLVAERRAGLRR